MTQERIAEIWADWAAFLAGAPAKLRDIPELLDALKAETERADKAQDRAAKVYCALMRDVLAELDSLRNANEQLQHWHDYWQAECLKLRKEADGNGDAP